MIPGSCVSEERLELRASQACRQEGSMGVSTLPGWGSVPVVLDLGRLPLSPIGSAGRGAVPGQGRVKERVENSRKRTFRALTNMALESQKRGQPQLAEGPPAVSQSGNRGSNPRSGTADVERNDRPRGGLFRSGHGAPIRTGAQSEGSPQTRGRRERRRCTLRSVPAERQLHRGAAGNDGSGLLALGDDPAYRRSGGGALRQLADLAVGFPDQLLRG